MFLLSSKDGERERAAEEAVTGNFKNQATANSTDINWEEAECVEKPFQLENTEGVELPSTGGIGTTIFYIVGSLLAVGAVILLVTNRRMSVNSDPVPYKNTIDTRFPAFGRGIFSLFFPLSNGFFYC